jgi:hypothetical protein
VTATATAARDAGTQRKVKSREASRLLADLLAVEPDVRRGFMAGLGQRDLTAVLNMSLQDMGTAFGLWQDDPLGFVEVVLGERTWSIPKRILNAIPTHQRIAVPSAFSTGKTWSVSRAVLWHSNVYPVGTAQVVTIAAKLSQVSGVIWPEIRKAHAAAGLPGKCDVTQLKMPDPHGLDVVVAKGIGAAPHNETAVQGLHAPKMMLIVDEAGGISRPIGRNLRAVLTADGTSMVAIGNPPTDDEGGWFETLCAEDGVLVIPISVMDTPNLTGEVTERCMSCPPQVPAHRLSLHLASKEAVRETIELHGEDSAYVQAKVLARFPKGGPGRTLPSSWLENASDVHEGETNEPEEGEVRIDELGLAEPNPEPYAVRLGAWVRLGVDVASDGGDELAISRMVGDLVTIRHTSSGATNTNVHDVAGKVLEQIKHAEALRTALGTTAKVRVKIDAIGLGWGVVGVLEAWGQEGVHGAEIVAVDVSEGTYREDEAATFRPANKRAEMWLAFRTLVQPNREGESAIRLRVDRQTIAQLGAPAMSTNSHGRTVIESKANMKRRGLKSPDRGEAVLLAAYEPMLKPPKRKARLIV